MLRFNEDFNSNFFLSLFSCTIPPENNHAKIIWRKYENGNYKVVHQYFTDTGKIEDDYYYQQFYENGNLKIQGIENQNIRKGIWNLYNHDKNLHAQVFFKNDTLDEHFSYINDLGDTIIDKIIINGSFHPKLSGFNLFETKINVSDSMNKIKAISKKFE